MDKYTLIDLLKREIEKSTGCTDPGAVCLAVSRATRELNGIPEKISVTVSPNVYKNGISVGIPGTGRRGLSLAAALGAIIDKSESGLGILDFVTENIIEKANLLLNENRVSIKYVEVSDPLYIKAEVFSKGNSASAVIINDYSNIVEVCSNEQVVFSTSTMKADETQDILKEYSLKELFILIEEMDLRDLEFLIESALINKKAAEVGLNNTNMKLGRSLSKYSNSLVKPFSVINKAQSMTAAAGEARMLGLNVPIMAIAGSGNHGITNFLGILSVAEELDVSKEKLAKALALSSMITVYIKGFIKRMTAFCGCSVAAATGVAAGTVYLLGGNYNDSVNAMQSVVGTLAGMFCDGAKESCAYKLSTATSMAIQFAYLAMEGCYIPDSIGIIGKSIEDTFENLGYLNNPGMVETDKLLVTLIEKTQSGARHLSYITALS